MSDMPLKILLLEDSATDAELVQYHLRRHFRPSVFQVAMTEKDFSDQLEHFRPHVVLADNSLPRFDAATALKMVRELYPSVSFIMVTGTVSEEFAAGIIREGADDYILKDRLTRLPAAIDAAIHKHRQEEEKKKALALLIRSEEQYRSLVDRISDGFMSLDTQWQVTYINTIAEQLLGRQKGTLLGKNIWEEFPEGVDGVFYQSFHTAMREQRNIFTTGYSLAADRWFEGTAYPSFQGITVYFRDITNEKKAREAARKSEEKYRVFIERITDAFISLDHQWRYTYLNPQAAELIQRKPEELIDQNVWKVFPDAVGSSTYESFHTAMREQRYICNTDYYAPLDLWQENHIYPSPDGLSVFIRNISEKKRLELELQEQEKKAQLEKIAASLAAQEKERSLIGAELHDNVNQILSTTHLLLSVVKRTPNRCAELIPRCMEYIKKAVDENRKLAHELVAPDLKNETLLSQATLLSASMLQPSGIEATLQHDQFDESLLSPDQKLAVYRILQEQCSNIIKHSAARNVWLNFNSSRDQFAMQVRDDGRGTEATGTKSKGIGLKNISSRLEVMGGTMWTRSAPGQGFLLEVVLPVCRQK